MSRILVLNLQAHVPVARKIPLAVRFLDRRPYRALPPWSSFSFSNSAGAGESLECHSRWSQSRARQRTMLDRCLSYSRGCTFRGLHAANVSGIQYSGESMVKLARRAEVGGSEATSKEDREILVQHLLVKEDQLPFLLEIQQRLTSGTGVDLSDLAEEYSICPSKEDGGMLGWISVGKTDPAFEEAAFGAPLNKLVRVKTKFGWHLLQVINERRASKLEQLQVEEFHERMQNPTFLEDAQLIDVREPDEIAKASIKGFGAYPLSRFGQWAPNIAEDLDPEKDTYVLCHHGMRSMQAAQWLQTQGFKRLYNIVGGIHAYAKKVDSAVPTY